MVSPVVVVDVCVGSLSRRVWQGGCAAIGLVQRRRLAVKGRDILEPDAANGTESHHPVQPCGFTIALSTRPPGVLHTDLQEHWLN